LAFHKEDAAKPLNKETLLGLFFHNQLRSIWAFASEECFSCYYYSRKTRILTRSHPTCMYNVEVLRVFLCWSHIIRRINLCDFSSHSWSL